MNDQSEINLTGTGSPGADLSAEDFRPGVSAALPQIPPGSRVLAVIPDKTRDDNRHLLFPIAAGILARRNISKLDGLVAQGTHSPMTEAEKLAKIGRF